MAQRIWLPYPDLTAAEAALGPLPEGLVADLLPRGRHVAGLDRRGGILVAPYMHPRAGGDGAGGRDAQPQGRPAAQRRLRQLPAVPARWASNSATRAGVHDASTAELAVALALANNRHVDTYARNMPSGTWGTDFATSLARPARPDHRLRTHRRAIETPAGPVSRSLRSPGSPGHARDRRRAGARDRRPAVPAARRRGGVRDHAADLPDTEHLIGAAELAALPKGALLVNVSRGKVVDTEALVAATASGRIRASLDVTDPEPLPSDHPLWRTPGVLISPHVGGQSSAFYPRMQRLVRDQLARFAAGEPLANVVA